MEPDHLTLISDLKSIYLILIEEEEVVRGAQVETLLPIPNRIATELKEDPAAGHELTD